MATLELYNHAFKVFAGATESRAAVISRTAQLRDKGLGAVSVNTLLRCLNAYFNWQHTQHRQERIRIPKLKEPQELIETLSPRPGLSHRS